MKNIFFITIIGITSSVLSMQQVGLSQASQALAAISPQLTQATRQASSKATAGQMRYINANNASINEFKKMELERKYPNIHIPPIYVFNAPDFVQQDILPRSIKRIVARDRLYKLPGGSALKIGGDTPIVMYDPRRFQNDEELEFILLHEIGHVNRNFKAMLAAYTTRGIKISFIVGIFFKMIALKYGILGYIVAPRLFWNLYLRFFEEPYADEFAIKHADKSALWGGKTFFKRMIIPRMAQILLDPQHPTIQSRINKIQRGIDGHPSYSKIIRIAILFTITEQIIELLYKYSINEKTIKEGLKELENIENNFEQYCDKFEIPAEGRPIYKYALEMIKRYLLTKLYLIELYKTDVTEEEILEQMSVPEKTTKEPTEIIIEEQPIVDFVNN